MREEDIKHTQEVAIKAAQGEELPAKEEMGNKSQATFIIELLSSFETWRTPDNEAYIAIKIKDHKENVRLEDRAMVHYTKRLFFEKFKKSPQDKSVKDALGVIEGKALFESPESPVFTRIAYHESNV